LEIWVRGQGIVTGDREYLPVTNKYGRETRDSGRETEEQRIGTVE